MSGANTWAVRRREGTTRKVSMPYCSDSMGEVTEFERDSDGGTPFLQDARSVRMDPNHVLVPILVEVFAGV